MNWHSKEHWGGYTFDSRLWPSPKQALQWLAHYGLVVGANLHDDDGVHDNEAMHDRIYPYQIISYRVDVNHF